jgi:hypothetical protein
MKVMRILANKNWEEVAALRERRRELIEAIDDMHNKPELEWQELLELGSEELSANVWDLVKNDLAAQLEVIEASLRRYAIEPGVN